MTPTQTEAQRLADELQARHDHSTLDAAVVPFRLLAEGIAELRRLDALFEAAKAVGVQQEQSIMDLEAERDQLREALQDMLAAWIYIRQYHGDLYGVGWDRAQGKAEAALHSEARK